MSDVFLSFNMDSLKLLKMEAETVVFIGCTFASNRKQPLPQPCYAPWQSFSARSLSYYTIGIADGGGGGTCPPLEINSGKFEIIRAEFWWRPFFVKITLILWEKRGKQLYIWKYFGLNIRAGSSCPPNCFVLLRLCITQ